MNTSVFFEQGDVVNLQLTQGAYPFSLVYDLDGNLTHTLILQSRVVYADALGITVAGHNGAPITPRVGVDPVPDTVMSSARGTFFPWRSVESIDKVMTSEEYNSAWTRHLDLEEEYYQQTGKYPDSQETFYRWENNLSPVIPHV